MLMSSVTNMIVHRSKSEGSNLIARIEILLYVQVTRERIRQIEFKALRKLKDPQRCSVLREYAAPRAPDAQARSNASARRSSKQ